MKKLYLLLGITIFLPAFAANDLDQLSIDLQTLQEQLSSLQKGLSALPTPPAVAKPSIKDTDAYQALEALRTSAIPITDREYFTDEWLSAYLSYFITFRDQFARNSYRETALPQEIQDLEPKITAELARRAKEPTPPIVEKPKLADDVRFQLLQGLKDKDITNEQENPTEVLENALAAIKSLQDDMKRKTFQVGQLPYWVEKFAKDASAEIKKRKGIKVPEVGPSRLADDSRYQDLLEMITSISGGKQQLSDSVAFSTERLMQVYNDIKQLEREVDEEAFNESELPEVVDQLQEQIENELNERLEALAEDIKERNQQRKQPSGISSAEIERLKQDIKAYVELARLIDEQPKKEITDILIQLQFGG